MLFERQKNLLALIEALGGELANTDLQKLLFLWSQTRGDGGPGYDFVPYRFGAFSFTSYRDRRKLVEHRFLEDDPAAWRVTGDGILALRKAKEARRRAAVFASHAPEQRGDALVAMTYRRYPFYACRSEIAPRVLDGDASGQAAIEAATPPTGPAGVVTLGYEGRSMEGYLVLLLREGVTLLCDVRRNPVSRRYGFAKSALSQGCDQLGIRYEHLRDLGIASARRKGLRTEADYEALFEEYERENLPQRADDLATIAKWVRAGHRVALTCFERPAQMCHRRCIAGALEREYGPDFEAVHL